MSKRALDLLVSACGLVVLALPIALVALAVKLSSPGPVLYWSDRVGRGNRLFRMPKFRSMRIDTPELATHLLASPERWLTPIGSFLRRTSLDELPQLWSVLKGDMSLVGPRPALYNQDDLIALRTQRGVHVLRPGITGWAQVNGRDELPIPVKVDFDAWYLQHRSLALDLRILALTVARVAGQHGVAH
ncbi:MAG TPA: sugar transferase [Ramlibacter sp.]|uniref:sugar transferase n=1 Tax=Ramlibacter sp. TaxID=1917967 RepID=UPI002D7FE18C|nr:sugar transferase [Ramlibacter sp.]HET8744129.1 sugar transferase [Ramlibacter sp.]